MKKEISCGAIIISNNQVLLIKSVQGHWSFPKGHIKKGETFEETALREIKEETNLDVILDTNFKHMITYNPKKDVIKDVIYFLGEPITNNLSIQISEVQEARWLNLDQALSLITYKDDKEVFNKAIQYLTKNNKI